MNIYEKLAEQKQQIIITSHRSPDGDAIGSSLALYHYLVKKGHDVQVVVPDAFPDFIAWLPGTDRILVYDDQKDKVETAIANATIVFCLDYNDLSRIGELATVVEQSNAYKAMIDHHLNPSDFCDWMHSDTASCSTAQMVYEFIENQGDLELIDPSIAENIYCGIVTDSGSFRFPSVQAKTHLIAADLINRGLMHASVHERLFDTNTLNRLHLLGFSLNEKLRVMEDVPVALIDLSLEEAQRFDVQKGDTEGLVNFALSVEGVQMAAFIREDTEKVKMSFRSKGDVPVNEFSNTYFNGGGHKNAAGGMCKESLAKTLELFNENVRTFFKEIG
ncbi:MAG: DHH family phosphoesterase [Flavobacteriales bacterium]|jgi:phosphoesterase RecJ-like protein|nr:DHH family phosphoesterase [Flavobacteriales bacterium]